MNKKNILILCAIVIILVAGFIGWPKYKKYSEEKKAQQQIVDDLKAHNPQLYAKISKAMQENLDKLKKNPKDFEALRDLGAQYQTLLLIDKAEETYKLALEVSPESGLIWNNLAVLYERSENWPKAKEAYLKIISLDPKTYSAYISLAQMYLNNHEGNREDAIKLLQQGILNTGSKTLKDALDRLNKQGSL
jgi:tetratricopeptide (TPR) repeat protein